jgi:coenzyme F420-0:L-glutamate ligase/coenzyme F420-1:gamma-L-glutamate ligase
MQISQNSLKKLRPLAECFGIVMPEFFGLFRREILLFVGMEMLFHLFYDMFRFVEILHVEVDRGLPDFVRMAAGRAQFPLLEPVDVSKRRASRAADNYVHDNVLLSAGLLKTYRKNLTFESIIYKNFLLSIPGVPVTDNFAIMQNETPLSPGILYRDVIMESIQVMGVRGLPIIHSGDNIAALICGKMEIEDGDILCVASTIWSKAKGYTKPLDSFTPGPRALRLAKLNGEDPRFVQAVLDASASIIMETPFILSELAFGHIGVRAGVDQSNIEDGLVIFLPPDPMKSAEELREDVHRISGKKIGTIITDTCGRSFRRGQTGNAIGWSGMTAIRDFRGDVDLFGHVLKITEEAVVDEIAGFSNFVMGESNNGVPAVIFRNCGSWTGHDDLYFRKEEDITRKALEKRIVPE